MGIWILPEQNILKGPWSALEIFDAIKIISIILRSFTVISVI